MTTLNTISKAKQARIDAANKFEQEKIIKDNLFISTYTEKLFKLAYDFEKHINSDKMNSVTISQEGFTFGLETYLGSVLILPHTPNGNLPDIKNRFDMIQSEIDEVIESARLEEEKQQKIKVAKDKINQVLSEEERKLLNL